MLKQKLAWLEASNMDLRRELEEARDRIDAISQCALESQVSSVFISSHLLVSRVSICTMFTFEVVFASSLH